MSKLSDHPVVVFVGFLAAIAGILTYVDQKWRPQKTDRLNIPSEQKNTEWWLVDVDGKKPKLVGSFVDRGSIMEQAGQYSAWTMIVLQTPQLDNAVSLKAYGFYDCQGNASRQVSFIKRFEDNTSDVTDSPNAKFKPESPDSMGQRVLNFICFGRREGAWRLSKIDPYAAMAKLVADPSIK